MLRDISPTATSDTTTKARRLRRQMSLPEIVLWRHLRARPSGPKFRRQHPSGRYILDFYCSDARLAIEIDGAGHGPAERAAKDDARDHWFVDQGIATFRIPARMVFGDMDAVVRGILAEAVSRLPLHHPAAPGGPPPRDKLGEE